MAVSLHQLSVVQMIKLFTVLSVFFTPLSLHSQTNDDDDDSIVTTELYNGIQYIIEEEPDVCYYVINSAYSAFQKSCTKEIEYSGETHEDMLKRVSVVDRMLHRTVQRVIDSGNISMGDLEWSNLDIYCYFDAKTKDLAGVGFMFDSEVKHYMTLERLNLIERTLLEAKINTGETNLHNNDSKYFLIVIVVGL